MILESISVLKKLTEDYKNRFGLKYINELATVGYYMQDYFDIGIEKEWIQRKRRYFCQTIFFGK